jgi:hypothetical protein
MRLPSLSRAFSTRSPGQKRVFASTALACAGLMVLTFHAQQPAANQPPQYIERSYPVPAGNEWPDKNSQMRMHQKSFTKRQFEAANIERKRQIDNDSAALVQLARELNDAVKAPNEGVLRGDIFRKAELIEKLAHAVKEKMKLSVTGTDVGG